MFDDLDDPRTDLAVRIYDEADGLTGSEVAEGMVRALRATDEETLAKIEAEFFPSEDDEDEDSDD